MSKVRVLEKAATVAKVMVVLTGTLDVRRNSKRASRDPSVDACT